MFVSRTRSRTVKVADDVGHAGLVAHDGSQVDGLLGIILSNLLSTISLINPL